MCVLEHVQKQIITLVKTVKQIALFGSILGLRQFICEGDEHR